MVGAKEPGCCEATELLHSVSPAAEPFAGWRTDMYLPFPNAQSWLTNMEILKCSVGILQERKNAFGLYVITLIEMGDIALGRICFRHQKSTSLFVRALGCFGRRKWCGKGTLLLLRCNLRWWNWFLHAFTLKKWKEAFCRNMAVLLQPLLCVHLWAPTWNAAYRTVRGTMAIAAHGVATTITR